MLRTILLYGISLAILATLLKLLEFQFFVRNLSVEIYIVIIAILFTAVGIWAGRKLVTPKKQIIQTIIDPEHFEINTEELKRKGISPREYEVLKLMARGYSNQEIAHQLFISLSTVKTHSANLFSKLEVKRRSQAVQQAKELRLIPWAPISDQPLV
jgi:two-component system, NarL family, response regulator LiaR